MTSEHFPVETQQLHDILKSGSFEEVLNALEQTVALLDAGQLTLNQSVEAFELGIALSERAEMLLSEAELRIAVLNAGDDSSSD